MGIELKQSLVLTKHEWAMGQTESLMGEAGLEKFEPHVYRRIGAIDGISDEERIFRATSWGVWHIMGHNLRAMGWRSGADEFLKRPRKQLEFFRLYWAKRLSSYATIRDCVSAYNAGHPTEANYEYVERYMRWRDRFVGRFGHTMYCQVTFDTDTFRAETPSSSAS